MKNYEYFYPFWHCTMGLKTSYYISDMKWLSLDPEVLANYRPQANLLWRRSGVQVVAFQVLNQRVMHL